MLGALRKFYPFGSGSEAKTKYVEPFVGGGAVLFDVLNNFDLEEIYIGDSNAELINAYQIIRDDVENLISKLKAMQETFRSLGDEDRKKYFLEWRTRFNELMSGKNKKAVAEKAAVLIFLNKTCFNGLYRVNGKGLFNVPFSYCKKDKLICDEKNLRAISEKLQKVKIVCGDYQAAENFIDDKTFVYFDPPYRPISQTSSFTSYTKDKFNDEDQMGLAKFVSSLNWKGAKILVSNSNAMDGFFDRIYSSYTIEKICVPRLIGGKKETRGVVKEILIHN